MLLKDSICKFSVGEIPSKKFLSFYQCLERCPLGNSRSCQVHKYQKHHTHQVELSNLLSENLSPIARPILQGSHQHISICSLLQDPCIRKMLGTLTFLFYGWIFLTFETIIQSQHFFFPFPLFKFPITLLGLFQIYGLFVSIYIHIPKYNLLRLYTITCMYVCFKCQYAKIQNHQEELLN